MKTRFDEITKKSTRKTVIERCIPVMCVCVEWVVVLFWFCGYMWLDAVVSRILFSFHQDLLRLGACVDLGGCEVEEKKSWIPPRSPSVRASVADHPPQRPCRHDREWPSTGSTPRRASGQETGGWWKAEQEFKRNVISFHQSSGDAAAMPAIMAAVRPGSSTSGTVIESSFAS